LSAVRKLELLGCLLAVRDLEVHVCPILQSSRYHLISSIPPSDSEHSIATRSSEDKRRRARNILRNHRVLKEGIRFNARISQFCAHTRAPLSRLKQTEGTFMPGRFVCPHGACFDHEGTIFVVEWVESGRVTKLQHSLV